jgi:hypothetical protein
MKYEYDPEKDIDFRVFAFIAFIAVTAAILAAWKLIELACYLFNHSCC